MKLTLPRPVAKQFKISSPFQPARTITVDGVTATRAHNGIDFACPIGTDVRAVADGLVVRAGWENPHAPKQGYGQRVMQSATVGTEHVFIWYGHLNEFLVKEGDRITKGQLIAKSGNTGHSTGPHIHLGVRRENTSDFFDVDFIEG